MDATLIETLKQEAYYCYKKFRAFQPLTAGVSSHDVSPFDGGAGSGTASRNATSILRFVEARFALSKD